MSNSRVMRDRFRERDRRRKSVAATYLVVSGAYLLWRTTVINEDALALSLAYFTAEVLGLILGLTLIFCCWEYRHREPPPPLRGRTVDVFIPTYREPLDVIRWTVIGAKEIAYPHQTFVLDDGSRPEVKALAEELGVRYLARGKNVNAKAGNLNYGLAHSQAEFVMVFDADHIALPHALDVMLGFFRDPRVAMVQAPQDFYNIDAFQYVNAERGGGLWHDQSFFYGIAEPCRDALDGASCIGTGVVYRRSALDEIGGIPTVTVTEDLHTSLKLHRAGYEVVYLNETIAYGIAATDIRDFYKTRHRWAHGNIHVLRHENALFCSGLTMGQRLSYLTLGLIYLEGWQQLLLFSVPWLSLLFGWAPFQISVFNVFVILVVPMFLVLLLQELGCGLSRYWVNEIFSAARFPIHLASWLALVAGPMPFRTSVKNIRGKVEWGLMSPQLAVIAISLLAIAVGTIHLALDFRIGPIGDAVAKALAGQWLEIDWFARLDQGYTLELVLVAGFWALFNAAKCGYLVRKAVVDAGRSVDDYRFAVCLPLELDTSSGPVLARVDRISRSWLSARVCGDAFGEANTRFAGRLYLPSGPLPVEGVITRRADAKIRRLRLGPVTIELEDTKALADHGRIECKLIWRDEAGRDRLTRSLYSVDWHREYMHRNAFFSTPLDVLGRLLALRPPFARDATNWQPVLYREPRSGARAMGVVGVRPGDSSAGLLAFQPLESGARLPVVLLGPDRVERKTLRVLAPESTNSLAGRGLDGATLRRYRVELEPEVVEELAVLAVAAE